MNMVFAGSFDPVTLGHVEVVRRALPLADTLYVAVMVNPAKQGMFAVEDRLEMLRRALCGMDVVIETFGGLLVDYCAQRGIGASVRGVRNVGDFEYEQGMADVNRALSGLETVILPSSPAMRSVSSSIARQLLQLGGDTGALLPKAVREYINEKGLC